MGLPLVPCGPATCTRWACRLHQMAGPFRPSSAMGWRHVGKGTEPAPQKERQDYRIIRIYGIPESRESCQSLKSCNPVLSAPSDATTPSRRTKPPVQRGKVPCAEGETIRVVPPRPYLWFVQAIRMVCRKPHVWFHSSHTCSLNTTTRMISSELHVWFDAVHMGFLPFAQGAFAVCTPARQKKR